MKTAMNSRTAKPIGQMLGPDEIRAATEAQQLCRVLERVARLCRTPTAVQQPLAKAG